jgi:tetratricopeptide (TPR) repeat protein
MPKKPREFVDKHREVANSFYELCEKIEESDPRFIKKQLQRLIQKDPDFLESYLLLSEIFFEEGKAREGGKTLNEAFEGAVKLITDRKGSWPDVLEWGWLENRHIIRAILNKGILLWEKGKSEKALELFRKLLSANPPDNPGVRYYILAIRLGISSKEFEKRFEECGYYSSKIIKWFEKKYKKFPDEFGWWEKAVEEYL